ncbi:hypothetical protein ANCCAN_17744 [Ancylostoma caninum]|uniref:Uncharacterized protein n=1 Tax=Ancylostoma caninum TaxID=29170 RepID=A0A368FW73_ANCCA|nr:hypothetical protein ANCCAN_17744 [Ancylostoma caninum]
MERSWETIYHYYVDVSEADRSDEKGGAAWVRSVQVTCLPFCPNCFADDSREPFVFSSSGSGSGASLTFTNTTTNKHWSVAQVYDNWIYAWTLPQHISQSRFGGRRKPSSACTIIALAMARVYHRWVRF